MKYKDKERRIATNKNCIYLLVLVELRETRLEDLGLTLDLGGQSLQVRVYLATEDVHVLVAHHLRCEVNLKQS